MNNELTRNQPKENMAGFKDKAPLIKDFILNLSNNPVGLLTGATCSMCHRQDPTKGLDDALSLREFEISGMCKKCQDSVFDTEA